MSIERSYKRTDVQTILACGKSKFWEMISNGEFPNAFRVGQSIRVPESDIHSYKERKKINIK